MASFLFRPLLPPVAFIALRFLNRRLQVAQRLSLPLAVLFDARFQLIEPGAKPLLQRRNELDDSLLGD